MNLHNPDFALRLKRDVRATVRAEPALLKEYRRTRTWNLRKWLNRIGAVWYLVLLPAAVVYAQYSTHHLDTALMVFNSWILARTAALASTLLNLQTGSTDIAALRLLPVADGTIFHWARDKFIFRQSLLALCDISVGYIAIAAVSGWSLLQWASLLVLVPLTVAFMGALAALGAARFPRLRYGWVVTAVYVFWAAGFFSQGGQHSPVMQAIDPLAPVFNMVTLPGWPLQLVHVVAGEPFPALFFAVAIALIFGTVPSSLAILGERFRYHEPIFDEAPEVVPGEVPVTGERPGETEIREGIISGEFLARQDWDGGWAERTLWRWFNGYEKSLAELVFPQGVAITRPWTVIVRNYLITLLLGAAAIRFFPPATIWVLGAGLFVVFSHAMVQVLGTGLAFRTVPNTGFNIPLLAAYPVTYLGLSGMFVKVAVFQMPAVLGLLVATCTLVEAFQNHQDWVLGIDLGVRASLIFFAMRFPTLVMKFSATSADTARFRLRTFGLIFFFIGTGLLFIGVGVAGIFTETLIAWLCCLAALAIGYGFFRGYGWFYNRTKFDLTVTPR